MTGELLSDQRAKGIRRLLLVTFGLACVLVLLSVPLLLGDYRVYGGIVLGVAVVLAGAAFVALRAVVDRAPQARRLSIVTGILLCVLSVPLMPIWVGLITIVAGIGLLVVILAPEHEEAP